MSNELMKVENKNHYALRLVHQLNVPTGWSHNSGQRPWQEPSRRERKDYLILFQFRIQR